MDPLLFQQKRSYESQNTYTSALPDLRRQKLIHNQRLREHLLFFTLFFELIILKIELEILSKPAINVLQYYSLTSTRVNARLNILKLNIIKENL